MIDLKVRKNRLGPVLGRHPWVFSGGLEFIPEGIPSGETVRLLDDAGIFLAQGYFNSYSQIAIRVWSYDESEKVDQGFFERRIQSAIELRKKFVASEKTDSYRVVNSENDFLPGLVVDKYADYLSIQFHNHGIEAYRSQIVAALVKIIKPKGIFERSDAFARRSEETQSRVGLLVGEVPDRVLIKENGLKFFVDIIGGQKTGFFLDQRDKRAALQKYVVDQKVLNCFSYTGGFSVYALAAGAKKVVSVDISAPAIEMAKENVKLNGLDLARCEFIVADVKEYLRTAADDFGVIILDPPAFIKDRRKKNEGLRGYKGINDLALRILPNSGILATCSCSAHLTLSEFRYVISEAAGRAKRSARILETYTHGFDHPELVPFVEGEYLKCLFLTV